jgi:hypothetical protein
MNGATAARVTPLRDADPELIRTPPYNSEAEQALLGALLINNAAYARVSEFLQSEHFGNALHARIYAAIGKLVERGQIANPVTLKNLFDQDGALGEIGGAQYLVHLAAAAVTIINAEDYGRAIHDLYLRRQLIALGEDVVNDAFRHDLDDRALEQIERARKNLLDLSRSAAAGEPAAEIIDAGQDDAPIPPRAWLLGNTFCRGFISGLLAQGASGKTALRIAQTLALATGRPLTGEHVFLRCRVLIVSLEDNIDELRRRVRAARLHHGVAAEDIKGWLYLWSPAGLKVAEQKDGSRAVVPGELERQLRAEITKRRIDLVMIDPLLKAHGCEENDNGAIDAVAIILARLAADLNCAIDTLHHAPKTGASEAGDANRGRGASAFRDAARLLYTVTRMTEAEREQFGLPEAERRSLIRVDSAKVNIAPPSIEARWFRIVGVPLGNVTPIYPRGDEVPVAEPWFPPDLWREMSMATTNEILDAIDKGPADGRRYSPAKQATGDRAAWRIVQEHRTNLSEKQCQSVIDTWLKNGMLEKRDYQDPILHKSRAGLFVSKRPG